MRKVPFLAAAFVMIGAVPAFAADMHVKAPILKAPPAPVSNWSGFYVGGSIGGLWDKIDGNFVFPPPASWSTTQSLGVGGGQVGLQQQFGSVVVGIEGDFLAFFSNGFATDTCHPAISCFAGATANQRLSNGIGTVGGRVGWAQPAWMPYVSGGYASTRVDVNLLTPPGGVGSESATTTHSGGYLGGGIDYMFAPHLVAGIEYRHYEFNSATGVPALAVTGAANVADSYTVKPRADSVVVRLNYLINWAGGPFAAK
jgi:outer membrane immunogenic protein